MRTETGRILRLLAATYPNAGCELVHEGPFELLVATMLSAQCTDARVNLVTPRLFPRFGSPEGLLGLEEDELCDLIRDCGLYRAKARNILGTCRALLERFHGEVPRRLEELTSLPGVGRKTANVVLSNAFAVPAIAVDTHVLRVARRLGLARGDTPEKVEAELRRRIPKRLWSQAHHWLIHHGRALCHARGPECGRCPLAPCCQALVLGLVTPR